MPVVEVEEKFMPYEYGNGDVVKFTDRDIDLSKWKDGGFVTRNNLDGSRTTLIDKLELDTANSTDKVLYFYLRYGENFKLKSLDSFTPRQILNMQWKLKK